MKKILLFCVLMVTFFASAYAIEQTGVVDTENSFGYAFGWVFTFDFFSLGILSVLLNYKKAIHLFFALFIVVAVWVGYLIVDSYELGWFNEALLFALCIIPGCLVYGYSFTLSKQAHTQTTKPKNKTSRWAIIKRYVWTQGTTYIIAPFVTLYVYLWNQTPSQRRKKNVRRAGWNVDKPDIFSTYLVVHRYKNPLMVATFSRDWKPIPIAETRSLGALSLESQKEIEYILDMLKTHVIKFCDQGHHDLDKPSIVFGKRKYSPRDILSRIDRRTPLGMRFLLAHIQDVLKPVSHKKSK